MSDNVRAAQGAVAALIDSFLYENPEPTMAQWKKLLAANPELASEIADFAMWYGRTKHTNNEALELALDEELFNSAKSIALGVMQDASVQVEQARAALMQYRGP